MTDRRTRLQSSTSLNELSGRTTSPENTRSPQPSKRRTRALLAQYYGVGRRDKTNTTFDEYNIDSAHFNADKYVDKLIREKHLKELIDRENKLCEQIKTLDNKLQRLVYTNYNKFISATDTIKEMKKHVEGMEGEMESLGKSIEEITECSNIINQNLGGKREKIEQLSSVHRMLQKLQFILELPRRLNLCYERKRYEQAVDYYNLAFNFLQQYSDMTSFKAIQQESNEIMEKLKTDLKSIISKPDTPIREIENNLKLLVRLREPEEQLRDEYLEMKSKSIEEVIKNFQVDTKLDMKKNIQELDETFFFTFSQFVKVFRNIFVSERQNPLNEKHIEAFNQTASNIFGQFFDKVRLILFDTYKKPLLASSLIPLNGKEYSESDNEYAYTTLESMRKALRILIEDTTKANEQLQKSDLIHQMEEVLYECVSRFITENMKQFRENVSELLQKYLLYKPKKEENLENTCSKFASNLYHDFYRISKQFQLFIQDIIQQIAHKTTKLIDLLHSELNDLFEWIINTLQKAVKSRSEIDVLDIEAPSDATATGSILLARWCLELSKSTIPKLNKLLSKLISVKISGQMNTEDLCDRVEKLAKRLLVYYIEKQGDSLSLMIRAGIETKNWLNIPQPRDVRDMSTMIVDEMEKINQEIHSLFPESSSLVRSDSFSSDSTFSTSNRGTSFGYGTRSTHKSEDSFHYDRETSISTDMLKLFDKKLATCAVQEPEFNRSSIVTELIKITFKTLGECIKMNTFSKNGYHQLLIDIHYLRMVWYNIIDDEQYIIHLVSEVLSLAKDRSLDPTPLNQNIIISICKNKMKV